MIDLDVRRNFFAGHGTGRDSSSKSAAGRDGTKLDLAGHGTGRDEKKIVDGRRDGTGQRKRRPADLCYGTDSSFNILS
jgi:hypothetical protein